MTAPIRWPAEAVWEAVAPLLPGFTVEVLPSIDSTNTELMRRARAGQTEPTLLVAEQQTAGRAYAALSRFLCHTNIIIITTTATAATKKCCAFRL